MLEYSLCSQSDFVLMLWSCDFCLKIYTYLIQPNSKFSIWKWSVTPYLFLLFALCIEIRILIKKLFQPIVYLNSSSTEKWQTKTRSNLLLRLTHFTCQLRIGPKKIFTLDWSFVTIIFTVHIVMDKKWFITTTKNDLRSEENVKKWRSVILV